MKAEVKGSVESVELTEKAAGFKLDAADHGDGGHGGLLLHHDQGLLGQQQDAAQAGLAGDADLRAGGIGRSDSPLRFCEFP